MAIAQLAMERTRHLHIVFTQDYRAFEKLRTLAEYSIIGTHKDYGNIEAYLRFDRLRSYAGYVRTFPNHSFEPITLHLAQSIVSSIKTTMVGVVETGTLRPRGKATRPIKTMNPPNNTAELEAYRTLMFTNPSAGVAAALRAQQRGHVEWLRARKI